ncbi:hypothetical protein LTR28_007931, partial [Elasticomyces elasticus]
MSLDVLRNGQLSSRRNDIASCLENHARKLRALSAVTASIALNAGLSGLFHDHDLEHHHNLEHDANPPLLHQYDDLRFLAENDLSKGHYFDDATLSNPFQHEAQHATPSASQTTPSPSTPIPSTSSASFPRASGEKDAQAPDTSPTPLIEGGVADLAAPSLHHTPARRSSLTPKRTGSPSLLGDHTVGKTAQRDPVAADPPHAPATLPGEGSRVSPQKPAQAPLSPERREKHKHQHDVQRDASAQADVTRKILRPEEQSSDYGTSGMPADQASSPSSTAGAWSATTPMPAVHSPDTSPDDSTFPTLADGSRPLLGKSDTDAAIGLTGRAPDHVPDAQTGIAQRSVLETDLATPDAQLRQEAQQAAALAGEPVVRRLPSSDPTFMEVASEVAQQARATKPESSFAESAVSETSGGGPVQPPLASNPADPGRIQPASANGNDEDSIAVEPKAAPVVGISQKRERVEGVPLEAAGEPPAARPSPKEQPTMPCRMTTR